MPCASQIPSEDAYQHATARVLFGLDRRALRWIKGEAMPDALVDEILSALGLGRDTLEAHTKRLRTC